MAQDALDRLYVMARLGEAVVEQVKAHGLLVEKRARRTSTKRGRKKGGKLSDNPQAVAARERRAAKAAGGSGGQQAKATPIAGKGTKLAGVPEA